MCGLAALMCNDDDGDSDGDSDHDGGEQKTKSHRKGTAICVLYVFGAVPNKRLRKSITLVRYSLGSMITSTGMSDCLQSENKYKRKRS